jgi:uncharacterized protein YqhQ
VRHSRAKEEEEEGRRKKKGQKEGAFLSLLQTNAHLSVVLSPTMFFLTFVHIVQIVNFFLLCNINVLLTEMVLKCILLTFYTNSSVNCAT